MNEEIQLALYEEKYQEQLMNFYLPEEQAQYTALPSEALDVALQDPNRMPVVILDGAKTVGFFVLHGGPDISKFTPDSHALLLRAFSVNHEDQGKGYARRSLVLLPAFIEKNFKEVKVVVLAVNKRNVTAQKAYLKSGFMDTGRETGGKYGPQYIYELPIES
ncbi:GNAT family N-acetyltransferase [Paenibacillus sp. P96]|uniref:GNAT family N-acetyltransferase n=1 Tax=Paenibacillus zeirhizosphaerae TaxID=2987519 RepID=A0ABT9FRX7_9BACL|nr:GNAT family N-acetyltransferase [Paenibacillus sp. P96]MDP4097370.1 GNAT family N-acetyltransferase [Paenibacillus sp. P96]